MEVLLALIALAKFIVDAFLTLKVTKELAKRVELLEKKASKE